MANLKKRILHHLASQLANVLYTIKYDHQFPIRYPLVFMSLSGIFIRLFVTKDVIISTILSIFFASTIHLLAVIYILYYWMPHEKKMKRFIDFIKNHREDPEIQKNAKLSNTAQVKKRHKYKKSLRLRVTKTQNNTTKNFLQIEKFKKQKWTQFPTSLKKKNKFYKRRLFKDSR